MVQILDESSIQHLPEPVVRSLRRSGVLGRPIPRRVNIKQRGEILLNDRWFPFDADQSYTTDAPSFAWTARVKIAGLPIARATDSLVGGRGRIHVRLLNLFTVVDASGKEMDEGALMRWLNETMWFPQVWATDVISWRPVDDKTAVGRVAVEGLAVEAAFRFDGEGRLVDFSADRYRMDGDTAALAPWRTPITDHGTFDGVEVPSRGSALWDLEAGTLEYIRLQITDVRYE